MSVRAQEAFRTLLALWGGSCEVLLSSYMSCPGGHGGTGFGGAMSVRACEEGFCSDKEDHGNLLICKMETSKGQ